ncbi:hypothetical protein QOZ88_03200 [Blastococcus sp. BMG 814]|uniref:DUF4386 family protein n=1 Tax=Blastococcus carthaginiensis TaxID=3050034 RepID=A0ABT9I8U0_9ACTN|nr:hypothetical protein [Blastococcus carthaginiensis]MDP5181632.1 hypothetical protein [Blastococcus carthaginiensis]
MPLSTSRHALLAAAGGFAALAVAGNALQGTTPAPHAEPGEVLRFYAAAPDRIAVAMMLSLLALVPLAVFLAALVRALEDARTADPWPARMAGLGGAVATGLLAGGFALVSAGALRAGSPAGLAPESAVVFYDGGLALSGLAAPVGMTVLLAGTAACVLRTTAFPRWFGWASAGLAAVGLVTPLSFLLALVLPLWVLVAAVVLSRRSVPEEATRFVR